MYGTNALTLRIADLPITLRLEDCADATRARIVEHYQAFLVPASSGMFSIRVRVEVGGAYIEPRRAQTWQIRTWTRNGRVHFESYYEAGWFDRATGQGELVMRPQGNPENFLRVLYAWLCLDHAGLLLHACGVIARGKGYAFCGPSGSGKTTVAGLSSDQTVLSDDLVIVRRQGDRFRLYGVPFRGDLPEAPRTNASAELQGLFVLVKDTEHRLTSLASPEATARISACVPFVMTQKEHASQVIHLGAQLALHAPVFALHFRRDAGFWEVIHGLA
jgi:hypothetical protein